MSVLATSNTFASDELTLHTISQMRSDPDRASISIKLPLTAEPALLQDNTYHASQPTLGHRGTGPALPVLLPLRLRCSRFSVLVLPGVIACQTARVSRLC